jgi:hypothetical protein
MAELPNCRPPTTPKFRSERMDKLLSFLQVRILPQEEVSCLRSDGVRVEGDRNTGATPDKR